MSDQSLFKVQSITVEGVAIPFSDGSARIHGIAGFAANSMPAGSGPDFESYSREQRYIEMDLLLGPKTNPEDLVKIRNARVVLKDPNGPRRVMAPNCSFGSMGPAGGGPIQFKLNVLEPYQWL